MFKRSIVKLDVIYKKPHFYEIFLIACGVAHFHLVSLTPPGKYSIKCIRSTNKEIIGKCANFSTEINGYDFNTKYDTEPP